MIPLDENVPAAAAPCGFGAWEGAGKRRDGQGVVGVGHVCAFRRRRTRGAPRAPLEGKVKVATRTSIISRSLRLLRLSSHPTGSCLDIAAVCVARSVVEVGEGGFGQLLMLNRGTARTNDWLESLLSTTRETDEKAIYRIILPKSLYRGTAGLIPSRHRRARDAPPLC